MFVRNWKVVKLSRNKQHLMKGVRGKVKPRNRLTGRE